VTILSVLRGVSTGTAPEGPVGWSRHLKAFQSIQYLTIGLVLINCKIAFQIESYVRVGAMAIVALNGHGTDSLGTCFPCSLL
jgi:hypothetical protein